MTLKTFFFGFDGRIARRDWWLGMAVLIVGSGVLSFAVNPGIWQPQSPAFGRVTLTETLISLAILIPQTALTVRRLNDRAWPPGIAYGYAFAAIAIALAEALQRITPLGLPPITPLDWSVHAMFLAATAFIVFEAGFRRGIVGPNAYGPEPTLHAARTDGLPKAGDT